MGTLYLLHFDQPISPDHTCQHYLGFTADDLNSRLAAHAAGRGARLTQVACERGITWQVVKIWEGGRLRKAIARLEQQSITQSSEPKRVK